MAGEPAVRIEIALARRAYDGIGQRGRRRLAVPAPRAPLGVEPVAQRLLVEARLRAAGLVDIRRPEARAVGGEHLVGQHRAAGRVAAELELGVGDDDAAIRSERTPLLVHAAAEALQLRRHLGPED